MVISNGNSSDRTPKVSTQLTEEEMRARLREGFLKAVRELNGEPCTILTYEQSELHAKFAGLKTDGSEILVTELTTPSSVQINAAAIRTDDILAVKFDNPVKLP